MGLEAVDGAQRGGRRARRGGPFVYIHFIQGTAPAPLSLSSPTPVATGSGSGSTSGDGGDVAPDGTWNVASDSVVGYRTKETIFGQSNVAVGRTDKVSGAVTIAGTSVTEGSFTVDMTWVRSDESRRDDQLTAGSWRPRRSPRRRSS
jgi:hypothetical protein